MNALQSFENQQYLNIETFRKNGQGVKTPVWFTQEGEKLFVWTEATSAKARRIRNNGMVNIAPSKADGTPLGEWAPARAFADASPEALAHIKKLMSGKYGVMFALFALMGFFRRASYTSIRIEAIGE